MPAWNTALPHVVSHRLATLFLVLTDQVPELFVPTDELSGPPEVTQDNLPKHADVPRGCIRLVEINLWHVLQPPLRFSTRDETEHVVQLSAPHLLGPSEVHVPHVLSSGSGLFHQSTQFGRDCR